MPQNAEELDEIKKKLSEIAGKLDLLLHESQMTQKHTVPSTLTSLPQHLQRTALTVAELGEATAEQVAAKTGLTRAAESDYLNQLASRSFLKRERRGKEVYFRVFSLYANCPRCQARVLMSLSKCAYCGEDLVKSREASSQ